MAPGEESQPPSYWVKMLLNPARAEQARERLVKLGAAATTDLRRMLTDKDKDNRRIAAEVLGHDGIQRGGRTHEAHEHGRVDAEPEAHGGQIHGRGPAAEHGIHHRERHSGELTDEDRSRLTNDAAGDGLQRPVTYRSAPRWEKRVSWLVTNSSSAACPLSVALRARAKAPAMSSGFSTRSLQPPIARPRSA